LRGLRPCDPAENQGQNLSEKENPEAAYALPLVGIEQDASGQAKTKLARTGTGAVKQLHVLAAASLAGFEVITDGRFCGDHRGQYQKAVEVRYEPFPLSPDSNVFA
jgi:hypothetical protein